MADPPPDGILRALSAPRRRLLCQYFAAGERDVADFDDLVDFVVCRERRREHGWPDDHRRTVEIQLYHVHLPTLADLGVVEFDPRSLTVRYRGGERLEALLEAFSSDEKVCA